MCCLLRNRCYPVNRWRNCPLNISNSNTTPLTFHLQRQPQNLQSTRPCLYNCLHMGRSLHGSCTSTSTYLSVDKIVTDDEQESALYTIEFLNSITPSGMPLHRLELKASCNLTNYFLSQSVFLFMSIMCICSNKNSTTSCHLKTSLQTKNIHYQGKYKIPHTYQYPTPSLPNKNLILLNLTFPSND